MKIIKNPLFGSGPKNQVSSEKELMYSSSKMMNRVADLNDSVLFCMDAEAVKPA
jgi:hypothetical protein